MTSPSSGISTHHSYTNMVTQLYTFSSWTRSKSFSHGSSGLPYVGFPGLTLTPIPENPLLDSSLHDDSTEHDKWLKKEEEGVKKGGKWALRDGSLPNHWATGPARLTHDVEAAKDSGGLSSKASSVSSKQCFMPKDDEDVAASNQERSHLTKLLLVALCGLVVVTAIVLWVFSPAFA
ncbi:hypothetical protein ACOMHN_061983 [Nucella lapillus]